MSDTTKVPILNVPNLLTVLRILLVPVFGWLLLTQDGTNDTMRIWAWVAFAIAAITDRFDGDIARKYGLVTDFGKMLDPIADKALMGMAFIGLSLLDRVWWWVTIVILGRELLITLMRFLVLRYAVIPASKGGKMKTFLQAVGAGLLILPWGGITYWVGVVTLAAALVLTVVTGIDYLFRGYRVWREATADRS